MLRIPSQVKGKINGQEKLNELDERGLNIREKK